MFDQGLEGALGSPSALATLASDVETEVRESGCRKLRLAAAWADAHSTVDHPDGGMLVERLLPFGPSGCPLVAEACTGSLAVAFRTSITSAKAWIGDALNLRHRLPRGVRGQRGVSEPAPARTVRDLAALGEALGALDAPVGGGRGDQHLASGCPGLAQRHPGARHAVAAARAHVLELRHSGHALHDLDVLPVGLELLGQRAQTLRPAHAASSL